MSTGCETAGSAQKAKQPARVISQYALELCEAILHPFYLLSICAFKMAMSQKDTPINSQIPATFMCNTSLCRCGRKRLSLIQMVLLRHLKAGFEKRANRRCDRDGYRPDTLGGEISILRDFLEQESQSSDTSIVSRSFKGILQHLLDMISINKLHIPSRENTLADLLIGA